MSNASFSQKLRRLEEVAAKLESPDIELEEGLKLLEEGVALHKECQQLLTKSQAKISKLLDVNAAGAIDPTPEVETKIETATLFESSPESDDTTSRNDADRLPF